MKQELKTSFDLYKLLRDENLCREYLEQQKWNGEPICPHCGAIDERHYKLKQAGKYKCKHCRKCFTVTVGTMFEGTRIPLNKWFYAISQFLSRKKGISSCQLARDLGVTQKTAWFMLLRIRVNLKELERVFFDGVVQMDETYVGGRSKGRFKNNRGRSIKQKAPVVGVLTKDKVMAIVTDDTKRPTLHGLIYGLIKPGSTVVTDEYAPYYGIEPEYVHETVQHGIKNYVNERGFHTNGIEGFWSHLKRGIKGIYHLASHKYLQHYCNEFAYRYNTRKLTDLERFIEFLQRPTVRVKYSHLEWNVR